MRDYVCHTINSIINAFEKSVNYPFKDRVWFGLCHFPVTAHVVFDKSSTITL